MEKSLMTEQERLIEQELQRESVQEAAFLDAEARAEREDFQDDEPSDGFLTDGEADADVLASAGWGTNEDYGDFGERDDFGGE